MDYITVERYGKKRRLYKKICPECNTEFYVRSNSKQVCCSIQCSRKHTSTAIKYYCAVCNKETRRTKSKLKNSKSGYIFCSVDCKNIAQRVGGIKEIQPPHYKDGLGNYRNKALTTKGKVCEVCGLVEWNNKPIALDVHHIDGNRRNNAIDNLKVVCPNCHRQEEMIKWG
jgi:HNH endonuclease